MQNGVGRCCVILVCFSFQFESKTVCLIGRLFSNFYVVHGSYIIKEKHRKITGVTLLRKLAPVPLVEFIVILISFWFVLSFYKWVLYVLIFLSASGLRVKQMVYMLTFLSARNFCVMCLMAKLASTL